MPYRQRRRLRSPITMILNQVNMPQLLNLQVVLRDRLHPVLGQGELVVAASPRAFGIGTTDGKVERDDELAIANDLKGARNPRLISDPVKKQSVASVT